MPKLHTVYIAARYRAETPWQIEQHIRLAEGLGLDVAALGAVALIPHTMTRHFHGTLTEAYWLEATLEPLRRCDAICTHPNWVDSVGARGEVDEARRLGLPVFHTLPELADWLAFQRRLAEA